MVATQTLLDAMDGIALMLDRDLRVVAGGWRNWTAFWAANGGAPGAGLPLGQDLTLAFPAGPVRAAFRLALSGIATGERPALRLGFRCDSPRVQRDMRLSVTRCGSSGLLYHSVLLAERPWPRPLALVPPAPVPRCTLCGRTHAAPEADAGQPQIEGLDWVPPASPEPAPAAEPDLCPRCHLALASAA